MAWDDNRNGVAAQRLADGAGGARLSDPLPDLSVRDDLTARHGAGRLKNAALKRGHVPQVHVQGKRCPSPVQIFAQLPPSCGGLIG